MVFKRTFEEVGVMDAEGVEKPNVEVVVEVELSEVAEVIAVVEVGTTGGRLETAVELGVLKVDSVLRDFLSVL